MKLHTFNLVVFFFKIHSKDEYFEQQTSIVILLESFFLIAMSIFNILFYCATIAYHVGLNANSGGRRTLANDQDKWTFGFGRVRGLVCTIAVLFGNSSLFSRWPPYWKVV